MKKLSFFAACICALALGSCVKDADVQSSDSILSDVGGNTSFTFTIQDADDSASSRSITDGTVEDSGVHDQGEAEEYAVNNVDIYLFDSSSEILVQTFSLQGLKLSNETSDDLIVRYESDKFYVDAGSYNIFAVANSSSIYDVTTQTQFLAYEDVTYKENSLMTVIPTEGFIMTNRASENQNVIISANEDVEINITLERVVVKVDVSQKLDDYSLTDDSGNTYAIVQLHNYMMVNLATSYYLFRHVADLTTFSVPTFTYTVNFGAVSDTDGYVIDPYFFSKDSASIESFDNSDGFFFQQLQEVETSPTWSMMPSSSSSSVNYCLENTMYQDAQLNGYTTGIVFQGKVIPTSIITDAVGGTTSSNLPMIYYCNGKFYNSIATLEDCIGNIPSIDDSSSTADLEAANIIRFTLTNNDYPCYYNYWIKHYDNNDAKVMGVMEFGVVRNNYYKLSITSVGGLGTGEPTVHNPNPDESSETLLVDLDVSSWIVRDQGSIEL
ncbi:MAG: Mfa1 family fimbria major subunit [Rikenellaceae bacterium]